MFLILFILNQPDRCEEVLDAWEAAGATGVTVLASTGLGRIRHRAGLLEDLPLMPGLEDFFQQEGNLHRTLISLQKDRVVVDRVIQVTQAMIGDLNEPNTGVLAVLPVLEAYGLDRDGV